MATVNTLSTGSEVYAKTISDAGSGQVCALNKAVFRITDTTTLSSVSYPGTIPLKAPCNYIIHLRWSGISTNGNQVAQYSIFQISLLTRGGSIVQSANPNLINSGGSGVTMGLLQPPGADALTLQLNLGSIGGTVTFTIEMIVFSNVAF